MIDLVRLLWLIVRRRLPFILWLLILTGRDSTNPRASTGEDNSDLSSWKSFSVIPSFFMMAGSSCSVQMGPPVRSPLSLWFDIAV